MFTKSHIVYVDTLKSFHEAKKNLDKENIIFITANPLLVNTPSTKNNIKDISLLLQQSEAVNINKIIFDLLKEIEEESYNQSFYKRYYLLDRRLNLVLSIRGFISSLIHKAKMIEKFLEKNKIEKIDIYTVESDHYDLINPYNFPRYISPIVFLANAGFFKEIKFKIHQIKHDIPDSYNDTTSDSLILKILSWPKENIIFHFLKCLNMTFGRKKIFYAKNCEALVETLPWLFFKGYSLVNIKIPSYINKKSIIDERDLVWLNSKLGKTMDKSLIKIFNVNNHSEAIKTIILSRISYGLKTSLDTVKNLEKFFDENLKEAKIILTSAFLGNIGKQVHKICKDKNIKLVYFEHGVTTGIASFASKYINYSEATTCDYLLVCSNKSKEEFLKIKSSFHKPLINAIGEANQKKALYFPRIQRYVARKKLRLNRKEETIYHVSSMLYPGNLRPAHDSPVESYVYKLEFELLNNVYRDLPKKVLFKKYPTRRMAYQPCYSEIIELSGNIKMLDEEDFRYTRSVADIIVTDSTQSTLAWCLSVNKPLIHLISKKCHSLLPSIEEDFKSAFITIDLDERDWTANLRKKLIKPKVELFDEWEAKKETRDYVFEEYVYGPKGNSGRNSANLLRKYIDKLS